MMPAPAAKRSDGRLRGHVSDADFSEATAERPSDGGERRDLIERLVRAGRRQECLALWQKDPPVVAEDGAWLAELASVAMRAREVWLASEFAHLLTALRWASPWYPLPIAPGADPWPLLPADVHLTLPKLQHDIEQFQYLQHRAILGDAFTTAIVAAYRDVMGRMTAEAGQGQTPLDDYARSRIGRVFNRILHVRHTPRLTRALSSTWSPAAVERQYLTKAPGVVVIDDFLSDEALAEVRQFCLESTVWSGNRYAHGRLGAFFHDGFNCPLLVQIAEELRNSMPSVIGDRYPLRQLWGFKNTQALPGESTTHADFAAVNVNFWVTPTESNLDHDTGGLVVYGVDAPLEWSFEMYNGRPDLIKPFLRRQDAQSITIPYRANRAIIFNSDLFHATAEVRFRPGYEHHRINVTMLYGDRADDLHHREVSRGVALASRPARPAWRSNAFSRARGTRQ